MTRHDFERSTLIPFTDTPGVPAALVTASPRPRLAAQPLLRVAAAVTAAAAVLALDLPSVAALALGAALGAALGTPTWAHPLGQRLLKLGVIALGAGLDLGAVARAGLAGLGVTVASLALTLALGAWLARRFRVASDVGVLVTVGTAICGGSAIAAAAPALRARGEDVGVALGVVFALNAAALVVFPPLGHALGLSPEVFARWCAIAIHDTSSVVGAAATYGPDALALATVTKLARALWIVPVVFALGWLRSRAHRAAPASRPAFPLFILGFLAAAAVVTLAPALAPAGARAASLGREALVLALLALGLGTRLRALREVGARPLLLGLALWLAVGAGSLVLLTSGLG